MSLYRSIAHSPPSLSHSLGDLAGATPSSLSCSLPRFALSHSLARAHTRTVSVARADYPPPIDLSSNQFWPVRSPATAKILAQVFSSLAFSLPCRSRAYSTALCAAAAATAAVCFKNFLLPNLTPSKQAKKNNETRALLISSFQIFPFTLLATLHECFSLILFSSMFSRFLHFLAASRRISPPVGTQVIDFCVDKGSDPNCNR